jgi:hypothetical protein
MTEILINTNTLPKSLSKYFLSDVVKIHQEQDEIHLIPVNNNNYQCPLIGILNSSKVTVESILDERQQERKLDQ